MDTRPTQTVQSIDRVFLILELLAQNPQGVSVTELCRETNLPKGTISRMLASLIQHGYAFQNASSKRYYLSLRLFEIGSKAINGTNVLSVARPYLEQLACISGEAVHLVSRVGNEIVYLYKEEVSPSIIRMSSYVGRRAPLYCTGVGKCFLAFISDSEFQDIVTQSTFIPYTPNTITTVEGLRKEILRIREMGYSIDNEEHEAGVRCVAVPILDMNACPVVAISIAAPAEHMDDARIQQYVPILLDTAKKIGRYYGAK